MNYRIENEKSGMPSIESAIMGMCSYEAEQCFPMILSAGITKDMFSDKINQDLFDIIKNFKEINGCYPDSILISDELKRLGLMDSSYLNRLLLMSSVPFIDSTFKAWIKQFLGGLKSDLKVQAYRTYGLAKKTMPSEELEEIENKAKQLIEKCESIDIEVKNSTMDAILSLENEISDIEKGNIKPITFEFEKLTDLKTICKGIQSHEFCIVAARPGCGKTSLLTQFVMHNLKRGKRGIFFSLEMGTGEIIKRIICQESQTNFRRLEHSKDDLHKYRECFNYNKILINNNLKIRHNSDINKMDSEIQILAGSEMIDFVALDYIQLVTGMDSKQNRATQIAEATRKIKKWTIDYGVPVISAAQLNRANESENRRPKASDLRESGSIEQDADIIILAHMPTQNRDKIDQENLSIKEINLSIAKNRNGSTGSCDVLFKPSYTRFFNLEINQQ